MFKVSIYNFLFFLTVSIRFEGKQLGMKAAERMRPILENWIQSKEEETGGGGNKYQKKRRKRTSFSPEYVQMLNECFQKNPKPNLEEMQEIASKINLDLTTVKVWFCNKKQTIKRLGQPLYRGSNGKAMKQEIVTVDGKVVKRKPDSPQQQQGIFALNTAGGMKTIIPASTPTGTVTMPFFISQDGNPIPIVSGATISNNNNQVVQPSTTLGQQIVHLSQVPILTSMVVNNNALQQQQQGNTDNTNDTNTEGNTATAQATQLISAGGRIISSGSVLQLPGGALQAVQQQAIQQAHQQHLNQSQNNGTLTNSATAVMMAAANAATGSIQQQQQATSIVNTVTGGRSNATETIILNKRQQQQLLQQHQEATMKAAHLKMSEKDLESDEVCVSDDTGSSKSGGPKLVARASPNPS